MDYLYVNNQTKSKSKNKLTFIGLSIYFLSLPLGAMGLSQYGSVLKYVAIIPILAFLISSSPRFRISKISFWQLLYTILLFISVIYSISVSSTLQRVETNMMFSVLLVCMGSVIFSEVEIRKLKNVLIWSSRITCILMIVFGSSVSDRLSLRGFITEDPNYINGYLLFGLVNAMQTMLDKTNPKQKLTAIIELLLYTYATLATGSRGGLFCIVGSAATVFLYNRIKGNRFWEIVKKIGLFVLIIFITSVVMDYLPSSAVERFQPESIVASRGTNRYEFWRWAIAIFKDTSVGRQFFGFGAGTIRYVYSTYGYGSMVTHNIFIEQLLEGGVITFVVYCCLIITCILRAKSKQDLFIFAVLIGFIVLSFSTSLYAFKPYWNAIVFCNLLYIKDKNKQKFKAGTDVTQVGVINELA